jgi:hypothetical protein
VTTVARPARRRPLWLTVPLYVVLLAVLVVDVWAAEFWLRVGGQLGSVIGGAAAAVVLVVGLLLVLDARRQWLLGQDSPEP